MCFEPRASFACPVLLVACGRSNAQQTRSAAGDSRFFVAQTAQNIRHNERGGTHSIAYTVAIPYPAERFICELAQFQIGQQWRGLREDALNPGRPLSLVEGWGDVLNGTRTPETRAHVWMSQWLNGAGDLLTYGLQYEYPAGEEPDLDTLEVSAVLWPADVVRLQLGNRARELRSLLVAATEPGAKPLGSGARECSEIAWTDFVKTTTGDADPAFFPFELGGVRTLEIQRDVDGMARDIGEAIRRKHPDIDVSTVQDRSTTIPDAILDFSYACRCKEDGFPDGLYVTEAVVYKPHIRLEWTEPARVLFYWNDGGDPAWKHLSDACSGEKASTPSCTSRLRAARIAFTDLLTAELERARGR